MKARPFVPTVYLQQPFTLVLLENTAREILLQTSYVKTLSINKAWQNEGYPFQLFFFFLKYIYFVLVWKHRGEILFKNKYEGVLVQNREPILAQEMLLLPFHAPQESQSGTKVQPKLRLQQGLQILLPRSPWNITAH